MRNFSYVIALLFVLGCAPSMKKPDQLFDLCDVIDFSGKTYTNLVWVEGNTFVDNDGNTLFFHGDYTTIKQAQKITARDFLSKSKKAEVE